MKWITALSTLLNRPVPQTSIVSTGALGDSGSILVVWKLFGPLPLFLRRPPPLSSLHSDAVIEPGYFAVFIWKLFSDARPLLVALPEAQLISMWFGSMFLLPCSSNPCVRRTALNALTVPTPFGFGIVPGN